MSRHQTTEQNQSIKVANESFKNLAKFKYSETTVTNQNYIQEEIKSRLNSGNTCYCAVHTFVFPSVWNAKIKICNTVSLSVVLYGCETWYLTWREEHRLTVFQNRVFRRRVLLNLVYIFRFCENRTKITGTLNDGLHAFLRSYRAQILKYVREREMFRTYFVEKMKHISCPTHFFRKFLLCSRWLNKRFLLLYFLRTRE
jgi:hypothetical protein